MTSIILPTTDNNGDYIDRDRVQYVYIFTKDGVKYIHCVVDGLIHILPWSPQLERWFSESAILIFEIEDILGIEAAVDNVPEKYKNKAKFKP